MTNYNAVEEYSQKELLALGGDFHLLFAPTLAALMLEELSRTKDHEEARRNAMRRFDEMGFEEFEEWEAKSQSIRDEVPKTFRGQARLIFPELGDQEVEIIEKGRTKAITKTIKAGRRVLIVLDKRLLKSRACRPAWRLPSYRPVRRTAPRATRTAAKSGDDGGGSDPGDGDPEPPAKPSRQGRITPPAPTSRAQTSLSELKSIEPASPWRPRLPGQWRMERGRAA